MTQLIHGEEITPLSINPDTETAYCSIKMAELEKIHIEIDGVLHEEVTGKFGGYGGTVEKHLPLKKVLTPEELDEWRFIKWLYKGQYRTIQWHKERTKFFKKVKNHPRINRIKRVAADGRSVTGVMAKR